MKCMPDKRWYGIVPRITDALGFTCKASLKISADPGMSSIDAGVLETHPGIVIRENQLDLILMK